MAIIELAIVDRQIAKIAIRVFVIESDGLIFIIDIERAVIEDNAINLCLSDACIYVGFSGDCYSFEGDIA